jgi:hypothetical protein
MAGFSYRKNLDGSNQAPTLVYVIGKASVAFQTGDAVRVNTSGFCDNAATAGEGVCGIVQNVTTRTGTPIAPDSGTTDTWTMPTNNQTTEKYMVGFIPALPNYLFFNDTSGTLTEAMIGEYFDISDKNTIDQGTASDTTQATFRLWEFDPDHDADASKGLFQVCESQFGQDSWDREA